MVQKSSELSALEKQTPRQECQLVSIQIPTSLFAKSFLCKKIGVYSAARSKSSVAEKAAASKGKNKQACVLVERATQDYTKRPI
jgi:hypothetical protein